VASRRNFLIAIYTHINIYIYKCIHTQALQHPWLADAISSSPSVSQGQGQHQKELKDKDKDKDRTIEPSRTSRVDLAGYKSEARAWLACKAEMTSKLPPFASNSSHMLPPIDPSSIIGKSSSGIQQSARVLR
jgi:hypothetical protein